jgi:hypothetical protein
MFSTLFPPRAAGRLSCDNLRQTFFEGSHGGEAVHQPQDFQVEPPGFFTAK